MWHNQSNQVKWVRCREYLFLDTSNYYYNCMCHSFCVIVFVMQLILKKLCNKISVDMGFSVFSFRKLYSESHFGPGLTCDSFHLIRSHILYESDFWRCLSQNLLKRIFYETCKYGLSSIQGEEIANLLHFQTMCILIIVTDCEVKNTVSL